MKKEVFIPIVSVLCGRQHVYVDLFLCAVSLLQIYGHENCLSFNVAETPVVDPFPFHAHRIRREIKTLSEKDNALQGSLHITCIP